MTTSELTELPAKTPTDQGMLLAIIERATAAPEFDLARIEGLLAIQERWEKNRAANAFSVAMADFKANPPQIFKNKHVKFQTTKGITEYHHATHDEVVSKIIAGLAVHGLRHRWAVEQKDHLVHVTCIITHALGHSEQTTMFAPPDESGSKSAVQAIASTSTLLQRYTLLAATGLSSADLPDADDRKDKERPELPVDVWTALNGAAEEGTAALQHVFEKDLSKETRKIMAKHYAAEWQGLKDLAAKVGP